MDHRLTHDRAHIKRSIENAGIISVIVPVYNVEKYIDRCLRSIVENDYQALEIICVNDGSTDRCGEKLKEWERIDTRIKTITTENRGLPEARNTGIRMAGGQYIAFIDSDDWIHSRYFSVLLSGLLENDADIAMCDCERVNTIDESTVDCSFQEFWEVIDRKSYLKIGPIRYYVWGKLYKRSLIQPVFDPKLLRGQDYPYNLQILHRHPDITIAYTRTPLYYYFYRADSLSHTKTGIEGKLISEVFIQRAEESIRKHEAEGQEIYVLEAMKRALSYQYQARVMGLEQSDQKAICRRAKKILSAAEYGVSRKERLAYSAFFRFPFLYRWYRIQQDPTLLSWERACRTDC